MNQCLLFSKIFSVLNFLNVRSFYLEDVDSTEKLDGRKYQKGVPQVNANKHVNNKGYRVITSAWS